MTARIYAATASALNRVENHPYLGKRPALLQRTDHGLSVRAAGPDPGYRREMPAGVAAVPVPVRNIEPRQRMRADLARRRVEALVAGFAGYVSRFEASNTFTGPSVYFRERAIERRRSHDSVDALLADERFLEYVYAVLPAWGMHRMGPSARRSPSIPCWSRRSAQRRPT